MQLLLRLYDPTEGAIFINGINLKDIDREKYHEHFGVLEQNFKTLSGMFQNVIRGEKSFDEKKLVYTMKSADIYEKLCRTKMDIWLIMEVFSKWHSVLWWRKTEACICFSCIQKSKHHSS